MKTQIRTLMAVFVVAFVVLTVGAVESAMAADEWFVLGQQTIKSSDPSAMIKSEAGRLKKDVKQVKISVDGADVQITKLVLSWDNRADDTLTDVGVVKSGGQTAPANAPGRKGRLKGVTVTYKILGDAPTANLKVLGFD
ncbi:MAG TPA: hypothetical protein VGQ32_07415 [Thermoanaerobaculia bacterium]|jgi:hypothetical protein|nr:hypothetical protein [Thermoanaerobaculia bacterium]